MLNQKNITKLVFLDIECKPLHETFTELPPKLKLLFAQQYDWLIEQTAHRHYLDAVLTDKKKADHELCFQKAQEEVYADKGHLHPEFAQIICISAGMIIQQTEGETQKDTTFNFKCASFCGESEKEILTGFLVNKKSFIHQDGYANNEKYIVGYNCKGFDLPFLSKRILYNGLEIPATLDIGHLKPWELGHIIDVKEHLKFGGIDAPSLESLCTVLGVTTAQDQFQADASGLAGLHKEKQYDTIKRYCEADVFALAQCYLKLVRSKEHSTGITNQLNKI